MKKIIRYFSINSIKKEILQYGFDYSVKRHILYSMLMMAFTVFICMVYRLKTAYMAGVMMAVFVCIPKLVRQGFIMKYRKKRFSDVDVYLHQIAYSFMRKPKINAALSDTLLVTDGRMNRTVKKALDELNYGYSDNAYHEAFEVIEEEYPCQRMKVLHRFLADVETRGGKYKNSLEVLVNDLDRWVKNVYRYEQEIEHIKRDTKIGILISMVMAVLTIVMSMMLNRYAQLEVSITDDFLYQTVSMMFIILLLCFYTYTEVHYSKDYLVDERTDKKMMDDYKLAMEPLNRARMLKMIPFLAMMAAAAGLLVYLKIYLFAVYFGIVFIALLTFPYLNRKSAWKRTGNDIHHCFTEWLRDVALNLNDRPLLAAVEDTYDNSPVIMRDSLEKFIRSMEADPSDIKPYYDFLKEFRQLDISATVRTLYSISELDESHADYTINTLIQRNNELIDKQEEIEYRDRSGLMRFFEYIPVLLLAFKMGIDMMIIITLYL